MDKKFLISASIMSGVALLIVVLGAIFNIWDIGFKGATIIGVMIVIPAIIWVLSEGVTYGNSALFFGGIAYIMYKNIFNEFTVRFFVLLVFLAILSVAFAYFASILEVESETIKNANNDVEKGQDETDG